MKLKLDENLSRHLKPVLSAQGHDVLTAADENLLSRPDMEIARAAVAEDRMLLTLDVEFADLAGIRPDPIPVSSCFALSPSGPLFWSTPLSQISSCLRICTGSRAAWPSRRTRPCPRPCTRTTVMKTGNARIRIFIRSSILAFPVFMQIFVCVPCSPQSAGVPGLQPNDAHEILQNISHQGRVAGG